MKKVGTWFLNNLKWIFVVVVLAVTGAVISNNMISSYNSYKAYESAYDQNDLEIRSNAAAAPKYIEINDDFKTKYNNEFVLSPEDLVVSTSAEEYMVDDYIDLTSKGGSINLTLTLEEKSFVDIKFEVASVMETVENEETVYGVKDLLNNVSFSINGEKMDDEVDLPNESGDVEFHNLIMAGFALPAGDVAITIKNNSGKNAYMPLLRGITLFSSQPLCEPAE